MTVKTPIVKPISQMNFSPGSVVTIPNVNWQEFEAILQELGEKRSSRVVYSHNTLEIMVPLPEHEKPTEIISDIVKMLLKSLGKRYESFRSTTFKKEGIAGVEPDASFYIENYQQMINRRRLEPNDPPPDLAIEIDVTSPTTLAAYEALEVPELWIYHQGKLSIFLFENGKYIQSETSPNFPNIEISEIVSTAVERSWQVGSFQALEEVEAMIYQ
ncbi:Uma2 family endonuclease [Limnoraphis robusta Tam1]|uniref:Uma2 family endonuclease n=1 Tax=Limnoraphis robusta CCNP1315 TaxID=3110306 RepID=A0ABU5U693_9CYAN|nr:Uma2 family endonuclease [Limnoraphis robusta]MEA5500125.1 Uma2 family endonuclease [Limnoraphis robusta BA-68 BA1]MEA5522725.1 Uma2 family endonuclease [Limnoraphis robusta CCNP1315]MEA5540242.1 Uma2 family endonuclease [Limnoraphis robusta Tam1]MEA5543817.1 Uma2 family endonuclease [Limnoraphis robusta CCNP1324]